jgi:glycosyltransferase involved in cell wall biosynthesis
MELPKITLITQVYNQPDAVARHVASWKSLDPQVARQLEFVVVDDFSDAPLDVPERGGLNLRLFRVTDDIDWNMPGCKNLAALMARADFLLFFDCDNMIAPDGLAALARAVGQLRPDVLYNFRRVLEDGEEMAPHINTLLMSKRGFFQAGGMDEDFSGHYGYEDVHFHHMWRHHVGTELLLSDIAFTQLGYRTSTMSRDTSRNQALIHEKINVQQYRRSTGKLRFNWSEQLAA